MSSGRLYIGGLGFGFSEDELKNAFSKFGEIDSFVAKTGYAFVVYRDPKCAEEAIREMDKKEMFGRTITVEESHSKPGERSSRTGCYNCGSQDHISRDCPEPPRRAPRSVGCFNCGKPGHLARDCPEPHNSNRPWMRDSREPSRRGYRSRSRSHSYRSRSRSPRRYSRSPRYYSRSPRRYSRSPRRYSRSPRRYSRSPRRRSYSRSVPRGSRKSRSRSSHPRSISPEAWKGRRESSR
ncbi:RNA-binding region RNP-1 domain-containing protein [Monocercomonoides exilis]|uniref:RNA-binding region RNP-1 domain-containing protein n=1 Tax=Monocercomonoides exilis TaxID=2049356 RepID=UPI00355A4A94|nr:RNA-binding region RNP-1 domain-containing protein [Monocercomonoides exilis]|eukprot:MONOS_6685.1-p1 / transcript=MONOS_6685.1 / gene=MONOS_6685 / organism=Monocercomonoides_exilis_PA203 / gene_product=unspecified product / transcript_product=unspecified product / location=Mono_scaffold00215:40659-41515(-) / protein_length=236 / sequence_SO=supercontig / SO=protein_coding / is_pseudo=false